MVGKGAVLPHDSMWATVLPHDRRLLLGGGEDGKKRGFLGGKWGCGGGGVGEKGVEMWSLCGIIGGGGGLPKG